MCNLLQVTEENRSSEIFSWQKNNQYTCAKIYRRFIILLMNEVLPLWASVRCTILSSGNIPLRARSQRKERLITGGREATHCIYSAWSIPPNLGSKTAQWESTAPCCPLIYWMYSHFLRHKSVKGTETAALKNPESTVMASILLKWPPFRTSEGFFWELVAKTSTSRV